MTNSCIGIPLLLWQALLPRAGLFKRVAKFMRGPQPLFVSLVQKAMTPAQRSIAVHANVGRGCTHRSGFAQHDDVIEPLVAQPEPRQRCAGQVVECTQALKAAKALAVVGLAMPVQLPASAMWAATLRRPAICNERCEPIKIALRLRDRDCPRRPGTVEQQTLRN
jgi:hypothetical protein